MSRRVECIELYDGYHVTEERDLAGEATEMAAYRERLRADISAEEAAEEAAEREANGCYSEWDDQDTLDAEYDMDFRS